MLGVLGGLTVFVSLFLLAFGLADAFGKIDDRYPERVWLSWKAIVLLAVLYESIPWVIAHA